MTAERLFDPAPYTKPGTTPADERVRKPKPVPAPVVVVIGEAWRIYTAPRRASDHGVAHFHHQGWKKDSTGREIQIATLCGLAAVPLTVDPGTKAGACPDCLARGATP